MKWHWWILVIIVVIVILSCETKQKKVSEFCYSPVDGVTICPDPEKEYKIK